MARLHATKSNKGNKKFIYEGRMYFNHYFLKGVNIGVVSAQCDQKLSGCKGRAWFTREGKFIK